MQQKPPANSQSPPIKGRAMPGVYNQMAELTEIKPETKNRWLIAQSAHSPLVRTLGIFFTSNFDNLWSFNVLTFTAWVHEKATIRDFCFEKILGPNLHAFNGCAFSIESEVYFHEFSGIFDAIFAFRITTCSLVS